MINLFSMLIGERKCVDFCDSCSGPMVCVEEDIDPHIETVLDLLNCTDTERTGQGNKWIKR